MSSKEMVKMITDKANRDRLVEAGVRNLREFGYSKASEDNILTVKVYRQFFRRMLEDESNEGIPGVSQLLEELKS